MKNTIDLYSPQLQSLSATNCSPSLHKTAALFPGIDCRPLQLQSAGLRCPKFRVASRVTGWPLLCFSLPVTRLAVIFLCYRLRLRGIIVGAEWVAGTHLALLTTGSFWATESEERGMIESERSGGAKCLCSQLHRFHLHRLSQHRGYL